MFLNFLLSQDWSSWCARIGLAKAGELRFQSCFHQHLQTKLSLLSYTHKPKIWHLSFFFIKFCLVNHSINNLLKVPYSIYGSLLLSFFFFFHWKVSMLSDFYKEKKILLKNIRALGNLQFWTTCQSANNMKTSLV